MHQPNIICGIASWLANTHICVGWSPAGELLTLKSEFESEFKSIRL